MQGAVLAVGLAVAVVFASMAAPATGHVARWESGVRITDYADNASFLGRVSSERRRCKDRRLVTVWKRNPGAMHGPVDTARTNRAGIWAVYAPGLLERPDSDVYFATIKRRVLRRSPGHRHVCKAARSPDYRIF
jgi:hypothetical protein